MFKLLRKSIFIILFCFHLFFINNCVIFAVNDEEYSKHLFNGRILFNQGKYDEALLEYGNAEKANPLSKTAIFNQALIYKNARRYERAISRYEKLLSIEPNKIIYKNLGEVYMLNAMPAKAINAFKTAIKMGQTDEVIYFWLGECYEDTKDIKNAVAAYEQAIDLDRSFVLAHYRLGDIYKSSKAWDKAQKELELTKELDPSIKGVYPDLMMIYFEQKRYEQALNASRKVQAIDPDNIDAPKYIAKIYKQEGDRLKKKLAKREDIRIEDSFAKKVSLTKKTEIAPPIVRVHIDDVKRLRFKCAADFFIEAGENTQEIIFEGKKNELYTIVYEDAGLGLFYKDKKIKKINKDISIAHKDPRATILIFDIEAGTGQYWASKTDRIYRGIIQIVASEKENLRIINIVNMEEYLYGVLPSEMPSDWPMEALKAQAIAARSEAYRKLNRHKEQGYDFCAGVHCQAYGGAKVETEASNAAIDETAGLVAAYDGKSIDAVYSNSCGGHTQGNIFGEREVVDYLKEKQDTLNFTGFYFPLSALELEDWLWSVQVPVFCNNETFSRKSNFRWQRIYTRKQLEDLISKKMDIGRLKAIEIKERHPSAHVHKIEITGSKGKFTVAKELNIRTLLGDLRSGMFNIDVKLDSKGEPATFLFYGGGWGHGVGMCQVGAATMAARGFSYDEILKFYYTGITLEKIY